MDLYVRRAAPPVFAPDVYFDCFREIDAVYEGVTSGTCTFTTPQPGTYYVLLRTRRRFGGTLTARYRFPLMTSTTTVAPAAQP